MQPDMEKEKDLHSFTLDTAATDLLQTKLPDVLKKLRNIELACIKDFAMILVEKYEEKEYLFTGSVAQFNEPLPEDAKEQLVELEESICNNLKIEESAHWVIVLQAIIELLGSAQSKNMLQTALNQRRNNMRSIFHDQIKALSYNMPVRDLERALPENVRANHYTAYMRTVHRICGALMINSQRNKSKNPKNAHQSAYAEKVPKEVEFAQVSKSTIMENNQ
jgi:hypothetical protein